MILRTRLHHYIVLVAAFSILRLVTPTSSTAVAHL